MMRNIHFRITGPTCTACTAAIQDSISKLESYKNHHYRVSLSVPLAGACNLVIYADGALLSEAELAEIQTTIDEMGFECKLQPTSQTIAYRFYLSPQDKIKASHLRKYLLDNKHSLPGFELLDLEDSHSLALTTSMPTQLFQCLQPAFKDIRMSLWRRSESFSPPRTNAYFLRAMVNLGISIPLMALELAGLISFWPALILGLGSLGLLWWSGRDFYQDAWQQLKHRRANMNTLFSIGSLSAWLYSMLALVPGMMMGMHVHFCAVLMITGVVNLGRGLREWLIHRASLYRDPNAQSHSQRFVSLLPLWAEKKVGETFERIAVTEIMPDDIIRVPQGKRIPVDGRVVVGSAHIMTDYDGQSIGKYVTATEEAGKVLAGEKVSVLYEQAPYLILRATTRGDQGHICRFYDTLESGEATLRHNPLIEKVARWFVPGVILFAALTMGVWALIPGVGVGVVLAIGLSILLCACPCSFALAAPISQAIVSKKLMDANIIVPQIEDLGQLDLKAGDILALDKTGTLTEALPSVDDKAVEGLFSPDEQIALVALENGLEHWVAQSLAKTWGSDSILLQSIRNRVVSPNGIQGEVNGHHYMLGSEQFLKSHGITIPSDVSLQKETNSLAGKTQVFVSIDKQYRGLIPFQTPILEQETQAEIHDYQARGVRVILLTGDDISAARACASAIGIHNIADNVIANQTPEGKRDVIRTLQKTYPQAKVVMLGDGRNDALALVEAAKQGIGIGVGMGADCRLAANILLPEGKLSRLRQLVQVYRTLQDNVLSNLKIAGVYNAVCLFVAAGVLVPFGYLLSPVLAAVLMGLSSLIVVGNAMRLGPKIDKQLPVQAEATSKSKQPNPWLRIATFSFIAASVSFGFATVFSAASGMSVGAVLSLSMFAQGMMCLGCIASLCGYGALVVLAVALCAAVGTFLYQEYCHMRQAELHRYDLLYASASSSVSEVDVPMASCHLAPLAEMHTILSETSPQDVLINSEKKHAIGFF